MTWLADAPPRPRRDAGFTLLEMLIVLAILAVSLGIIAARGPASSPTLDVRSTANQVAAALRLTRSLAIARNQDAAFTLDLAAHAYRVAGGPWHPLPAALALGITTAASETASPTLAGIRFAPDGASTGGQIRIAAGPTTRTIAIDWLSGRVTVASGG